MVSPAAGLSPASSGAGSVWGKQQPSLERLVTHYVAAKRSLTSTNLVYRATELVGSAREALKENAVLSAKSAFVKRSLEDHLNSLKAVHQGIEQVRGDVQDEFNSSVHALDDASSQLRLNLDHLRNILVDPAFRPANDPPRYLFDFVDEAGVNGLNENVRRSIDRFNDAHEKLLTTLEDFESDLSQVRRTLDGDVGSSGSSHAASPVPRIYRELEHHATETATCLSSLVNHYDLCLSALRHTSGGAEAVERMVQSSQDESHADLPAGLGLELGSPESTKAEQSLSESERNHILSLVEKDSHEVDGVVTEMRERVATMQNLSTQVDSHLTDMRTASEMLHSALDRLRTLSDSVHTHVSGTAVFLSAWDAEKETLATQLEELDGLVQIYQGFEEAYDNMIMETVRRERVRAHIDKVLSSALSKVEKLVGQDAKAREEFRAEVGEFLPGDIWAGLMDPPSRWEVRQVEGSVADMPNLSERTLEDADRRVRRRAEQAD
ncbi:hypothetical protein P152DRAFT_441884 [Eremomyces bilateralis CBS 781.70]|uniref:Autophagy-related protein 17 n=1 Tax=Eremomyces bilateralis CBS 781.70 TaxID=1392243 RepID=A0A6G1FUB3_9PEZI|nr:uncharacterized protein P152DRAFT_441884 [Eremomyces bilateralis CBS 781.70]KAF1809353.1 hypothetical protein P152DRAFT_441884 [Eremomyces bilateralis CBS 781.70]